MKVCIAGRNDIAADVLDAVAARLPAADIGILPSRGDRGADGWQRSLSAAAARHGVREVSLAEAQQARDVVFLSLGFDRIVAPSRFRSSRLFNVHFSLLPAYRGMYPMVWPILNGETATGVTLHWIDAGIDTGDLIAQQRVPIAPGDTSRDLFVACMRAGTALALTHLDVLLTGTPARTPQPATGASYYARESIDFADIRIDLTRPAAAVRDQIRAFAFPEYQLPAVHGHRVTGSAILATRSGATPGTILGDDARTLTIATRDFDLAIRKAGAVSPDMAGAAQ